jgi:hypothetical protein
MSDSDKPKWYVFVENFNKKQIEVYNIFDHHLFKKDCDEAWAKYKNDFFEFEKAVRRILKYYFWCKCEWEIILSDFPPSKNFNDKKIDVFTQVEINWDNFISYLIEYYWKDYVSNIYLIAQKGE